MAEHRFNVSSVPGLHRQGLAMLIACKCWTSERECADAPHTDVPNAPSGPFTAQSDLVARAREGDAKAIEQLLRSLRQRAMAAALRVLHNPDDAEDAVQDAFLKIWRSLPSFEGRSSFQTWVHRIVVNASLDLVRRQAARAETSEHTDQHEDADVIELGDDETPESELAKREIGVLVRQAVATLPATHRQILELREFQDCSYQEMAEIIHCPIGTIMSRLHIARGRLAEDLRPALAEALAA
jgi:RNA polymerase sigma-70 factor (ECF subfamily)